MSDPWLTRLEKKITRISDRDYSAELFSLEQLLVMAAGLYRLGSGLRLRLYRAGLLKSKRLPCFVISIGNIMAGGAGKTPMAIYIAELLMKMGKRPVVISRGYKGSLKARAGVVSDGKTLFLDAEKAGDEPYMMAVRKSFPVVVGADRYAAGKLAIELLHPDVIVLDDAFAHVKLERDLNILLFDHDRPLGNKRILPAGRLRETPAMSKNRTQAIVLTRCPEKEWSSNQLRDGGQKDISSQYGQIPCFKTCHVPYLLKLLSSKSRPGAALPCQDSLKDRRGLLFSGIANNKSFRQTAEELGVKVADHLEFKDHYRYKRADILWIKKRARQIGTNLIVTTEKDWVKLGRDIQWDTDLAVIGIKIRFENEKAFEGFIKSKVG
ncbi:MAG: tetraacyldisaccharide 4'-kinase [Desulfobacteraceae bacterium]|nr:tetraacyldisaccharide 4'-kinase [Desulfobacteraceae bacterium]